MMPTGHIAVSYLCHRCTGVDLRIAVAATLFPDVLDKTLKLVLMVEESGRTWGHGLPSVVLMSVIVGALLGRGAGLAWATGHLAHLLADYPFTWHVPWLFPFVEYTDSRDGPGISTSWPEIAFDLAAVCLATMFYLRSRSRLREQPAEAGD